MNELEEFWKRMVKLSFEKKMDYVTRDGKEMIIDVKNQQFFLKCKAKDFRVGGFYERGL